MPDKALIWLGSSLLDLRIFLRSRRMQASASAGSAGSTRRLEGDANRWPRGQRSIHIAGAHRVFYVTTRPEAIYVLHAFEKKTRTDESGRPPNRSGAAPQFREVEATMTKNALDHSSTGNVFRDLGFSEEESEHLLVRADLRIHLQKTIVSRGLKQAEAAKVLRVTQPRVSDLLRGRIDLFSTDALIDRRPGLASACALWLGTPLTQGGMTLAELQIESGLLAKACAVQGSSLNLRTGVSPLIIPPRTLFSRTAAECPAAASSSAAWCG